MAVDRILGVDLGISSLGWAIVEFDKDNIQNNKIIDCGVRLFTAAQTPKEKLSPNLARREARGVRRVLNRRRVRMMAIKKLFIENGMLQECDINTENGMFNSKANRTDVWQLRSEALRRTLNANELVRVLIHIAKHRGYKFLGDDDLDDDSGKVKKAGNSLKAEYEAANCKTIGEYLWQTYGLNGKKRNQSGEHKFSISRDLLNIEVEEIFNAQRSFNNSFATNNLKDKYKSIAFFVKEPPSIEHMVGNCTFFQDEKRAPKYSLTAERFVALTNFFNTVIVDNFGVEKKLVELKTIDELMEFAATKEKLEYKDLRKFLKLDENQIFKGLLYEGKPKAKKKKDVISDDAMQEEFVFDKNKAESKMWIQLKGHAKLKTLLGENFADFTANIDIADEVCKILTYHKSEKQKEDELKKLKINDSLIEKLKAISFNDFNMLSIKAMRVINKIMADGYQRYDEAVKYALENNLLPQPQTQKDIFLPPLKDTDIAILNPTVIRAFAEFRKVTNALVRKYGTFDKVHFELAREVNTKDTLEQIKQGQLKNEKAKKDAATWIEENFAHKNIVPTRKSILKVRLYNDQQNRCAYTGATIELDRLFEDGYCEIDHILPKSRSADDSYANKVLCLSSANQEKTNRTPYEWFGSNEEKWRAFEARINTPINKHNMGKGKVDRLLKPNFDENSQKEFVSRNINDTRYMAKAIKTYCEKYWKLSKDDDKLRIQVRSGKLTSELRSRWIEGYLKDRSIHTHHALDAIVIAFATQSMVQKLANFYNQKELRHYKEKPTFDVPMQDFKNTLDCALIVQKEENGKKQLLISRPPRAGITGQAHDETIYSQKYGTVRKDGGKLNKYGIESTQGGYVHIGKGELLHAVKTNSGIAKNGDVVRWDIFYINNKYEFLPIYIQDIASNAGLPNVTLNKKTLVINNNFCFSLYKNNLLKIEKANGDIIFGYYLFMESDGRINIEEPQGGTRLRFSVTSANKITKYAIDSLGYYVEVQKEKRLGTIPEEAKRNDVNERRAKKQAEKHNKNKIR